VTRRGMTLAEGVVASAVFCILATVTQAFFLGGNSASAKSVGANAALQSVALAVEAIRRDANHLVFQRPEDLIVAEDGRGIGMLVPTGSGDDLWQTETHVVQYALEPVAGARGVYRLVRKDGDKKSYISGCLLQNLTFSYIPPGTVSALQGYIQIAATGVGSVGAKERYTGAVVIPITPAVHPDGYAYPEEPNRS
jgi:type II secretory pathway pseudopilin PulG